MKGSRNGDLTRLVRGVIAIPFYVRDREHGYVPLEKQKSMGSACRTLAKDAIFVQEGSENQISEAIPGRIVGNLAGWVGKRSGQLFLRPRLDIETARRGNPVL